jgi:hypothetical protein
MDVSLKPLIEIDQEPFTWRGSLEVDGSSVGSFFESYSSWMSQMAELAVQCDASRLYIGSELAGLTQDPLTTKFWRKLIAELRSYFPNGRKPLSYAANYDEYTQVQFWDDLDEIGVDAYFPLSKKKRPLQSDLTLEALTEKWHAPINRLHQFAEQWSRNVVLSEFGVPPYAAALHQPWEWRLNKSERPNRDEGVQMRTIEALLISIRDEAQWLTAVDLWHWKVPDSAPSEYDIDPNSPVSRLIQHAV